MDFNFCFPFLIQIDITFCKERHSTLETIRREPNYFTGLHRPKSKKLGTSY